MTTELQNIFFEHLFAGPVHHMLESSLFRSVSGFWGVIVSKVERSVSFPLDSEGFLRRSCPKCRREFKWLHAESAGEAAAPEEYYCPYCGMGASPEAWFTPGQIEHVKAMAFNEVVRPALKGVGRSLNRRRRSSSGPVRVTGRFQMPSARRAPPLSERDDMKRVEFNCHPTEPVKVDEAWEGAVHCLCCGGTEDVRLK